MLPSNCSARCGSCARQLYDGANDDLLQEDFCHNCVSRVCLSQSPGPHGRPLLTHASTGDAQTLKGRSGSVSVGLLVLGAHKVLFEPSEHLWQVWGLILNVIFAPPTILLGLLLCPWTWCIFFWWDPTFSCWWVFSSELQFWNSYRRRWVNVLLLCHLALFSWAPNHCRLWQQPWN